MIQISSINPYIHLCICITWIVFDNKKALMFIAMILMPCDTNIIGIIYSAILSVKWDQLMSPPTLKVMDEKFIVLC